MRSIASFAGHPIHPMIIPLPIGLWIFSLACDIIAAVTGGPSWRSAALYSMGGGIIGALLAALPGFVDLFTLTPSPAKRIGIWHMGINLAIVILYVINFLLRRQAAPGVWPLVLSIVGVLLLTLSGWLGGEMVYVHGVSVEPVDRGERRSQ